MHRNARISTAGRAGFAAALLMGAMLARQAVAREFVDPDLAAAVAQGVEYALKCGARTGNPRDVKVSAINRRNGQLMILGTYTQVPSFAMKLPFRMETQAGFSEFSGTFQAVADQDFQLLSVQWKLGAIQGAVPPNCLG